MTIEDHESRIPPALRTALALLVTHGPDPQGVANDLLAFALSACVAISHGTAADALAIYEETIRRLNVIVDARNVGKGPPS